MSHPYIGPLSGYNSLTDKHLTGYFNNTRIRRHLQRAGLVTRSGRIFTEKEYRINAMRRDHQKYIRECLAQAIFHKVLDMERRHQIDIKRKLETFARKERVQRIKVDHSSKVREETFPAFSPHPPVGPKSGMNRHLPIQDHSDSSESVSSPRPNTAPGNMQRPVRLQPLPAHTSSGNEPKMSAGSRQKQGSDDDDHRYHSGTEKDTLKTMNTTDHSLGISPYRLPIINNFVMPVPPPPQKQPKQRMSTMSRGRRYRPTTAPNDLEVTAKDTGKFHKTSLHSNVKITMVYVGKNVHLSHDDTDYRDEVKVFQQHCGGENLCVYKGRLLEEECFSLVSRRHRGFPFSLTFYINGIQVDRLSSCCEYKHRKGARLGGKNGYFGFIDIEGASPCYRCIIAMGLDKKPSPPPPKIKRQLDKNGQEDEELEEAQNDKSEIDDEGTERYPDEPDSTVGHEDDPKEDKSNMDYEEDGEEVEGDNKDTKTDEYEADDEAKDDYDEDFEEEEYKPDDKRNKDRQADDQVDEESKSSSDDEKDDLDQEPGRSTPSKEEPEASDSDRDESERRRDSDSEEHKQDRKHTDSYSSNSSLDSSYDERVVDEAGDAKKKKKKKRHRESEEHPDPDEQATLEKEPELEELVIEKLATAIDEGDSEVDENMENDADQPELGKAEDKTETSFRSHAENEHEGGRTSDLMDEDKPKLEDDLDSENEEEGGEYRL
ncbi:PREDICTED: glutamate-rich protein 3 [Nanorana parkeri]|uniref:glutamate-rich protein 3 n=1 Tax=Nanorana parkeri TaxID=125878 RepID=UPI0008540A3C|nr:PREDICTED: glutamate-rich protein 3 [Nanorana parkeri]